MSTETLYADAHLSGTFSTPDNAVGSTTGTWAGDLNTNSSVTSRWSMPTPSGALLATPDQVFTVWAKKGSNSGTPTVQVNLWENGVSVASGTATNVTSTVGQAITLAWAGSLITSPADVEVEVVMSAAGGSPSARNSAQVDYIEWSVQWETAPAVEHPMAASGAMVTDGTAPLDTERPLAASGAMVTDGTAALGLAPAGTALVPTSLISFSTTSPTAASTSAGSATYTADDLVVVAVTITAQSSAVPDTPTLSGWGTTWTLLDDDYWTSGSATNRRSCLFTGAPPSAGTGALSVDYTNTPGGLTVFAVQTIGGRTLAQTVVAASGSVTANLVDTSITMATPASVDNRFIAFASVNIDNDTVRMELAADPSGTDDWVTLGTVRHTAPTITSTHGWLDADPATDLTPGFWSPSSAVRWFAAMEVSAATGGPTAHALASSGAVVTTGTATLVRTAPLTSSGTTTTGGSVPVNRTAPLASSGAVVTTGTVSVLKKAPLTSSGAVVTTGTVSVLKKAPLTSSGAVVTTGTVSVLKKAPLTSSGAVVTTGTVTLVRTAPLAASGTTTTGGSVAMVIEAGGTLSVSASGTTSTTGTATLVRTAPLTSSGAVVTTGTVTLVRTAPLAASGATSTTGTATLALVSPLTATGTTGTTGSATLVLDVAGFSLTVTASGSVTMTGSATLLTEATVTASGSVTMTGSAPIDTTSAISAEGPGVFIGSAIVLVEATLVASGDTTFEGTATLGQVATLVASGGTAFDGNATLATSLYTIVSIGGLEESFLVIEQEGAFDTSLVEGLTATPRGLAPPVAHPLLTAAWRPS